MLGNINFKHYLKAENIEDSLASLCEEFCIGFHVTQYDETGFRSNSTSDCMLALPVQRYTTGHWLTLPRRSQTYHQYFCSQKMLKINLMLPQ